MSAILKKLYLFLTSLKKEDDKTETYEHYVNPRQKRKVTKEMRGQAYVICRDYLNGAWKKIGSEEMVIKHISGGLSNLLYYCALPSPITPVANEPGEVLVRFYGQVHGEGALESLLAESVIFTLLSERRLGPRLYGVFPGGRLEQYIPAQCLNTEELANPQISRQVAIRMARMHALNVPISKEPTWIWNCMKRWLKSSDEFLRTSSSTVEASSPKASMLEKLRQFKYEDEMTYIHRLVTKIQSPVVFAHNDMQEGNILMRSGPGKLSDKISLIDFEYCSYNYRGYDLANHFCEWMYCYKVSEEPFFLSDRKGFPNVQQQLNFIRAYLFAFESECGRKVSPTDNNLPSSARTSLEARTENWTQNGSLATQSVTSDKEEFENEDSPFERHAAEKKLLQEVQVFTLASHMFWTLWSIVQAHVSKIPFGYLEYALLRMEHYNDFKKQLKSEDIMKRKADQLSNKN